MESMICAYENNPERRRSPRMPYGAAAIYKTASIGAAGTIRDISADGMFIETPLAHEVGDQITIAFNFRNSNHQMNLKGEIARSTDTGIGVQFLWN
jgi:hypothetical protein